MCYIRGDRRMEDGKCDGEREEESAICLSVHRKWRIVPPSSYHNILTQFEILQSSSITFAHKSMHQDVEWDTERPLAKIPCADVID